MSDAVLSRAVSIAFDVRGAESISDVSSAFETVAEQAKASMVDLASDSERSLNGIGESMETVASHVESPFAEMGTSMLAGFNHISEGAAEVGREVSVGLKSSFDSLGSEVYDIFESMLNGQKTAIAGFGEGINAIGKFTAELVEVGGAAVLMSFKSVLGATDEIATGVLGIGKAAIDTATSGFKSMMDSFPAEGIKAAISSVQESLVNMLSPASLKEGLASVFSGVVDAVSSAGSALVNAFADPGAAVVGFGVTLGTTRDSVISYLGDMLTNFKTFAYETVSNIGSTLWDKIVGSINTVATASGTTETVATGLMGNLASLANNGIDYVTSAYTRMATAVGNATPLSILEAGANAGVSALSSLSTGFVNLVSGGLKGAVDGIGGFLSNVGSAGQSIGSLVSGGLSAMKNGLVGIGESALSVGESLIGGFAGAITTIAAGLEHCLEAAGEFNKMARELRTETALTKEQANQTMQAMVDLSKTIPLPAEQFEKLAERMARSGATTKEEIALMVEQTAKVAIATGQNSERVGDFLTEMTSKYGIAKDQMLNIGSVVDEMGVRVKGGVSSLMSAMQSIKFDKALGLGPEFTAALIASLDQVGIRGEMAAGMLNRGFMTIKGDVNRVGEAVGLSGKALGEAFAKGGEAAQGAMIQVIEKMQGMKVGTDAYAQASKAMGKQLVDALIKVADQHTILEKNVNIAGEAMKNTSGLMGKYADNSTTLDAKLQLLKSDFFDMAQKIGQNLMPMCVDLMDVLLSLRPVIEGGAKIVSLAVSGLVNILYGLAYVAEGVWNKLIGGWQGVWEATKTGAEVIGLVFREAADWIKDFGSRTLATLGEWADKVTDYFGLPKATEAVSMLWKGIKQLFGEGVDWVGSKVAVMKSWWDDLKKSAEALMASDPSTNYGPRMQAAMNGTSAAAKNLAAQLLLTGDAHSAAQFKAGAHSEALGHNKEAANAVTEANKAFSEIQQQVAVSTNNIISSTQKATDQKVSNLRSQEEENKLQQSYKQALSEVEQGLNNNTVAMERAKNTLDDVKRTHQANSSAVKEAVEKYNQEAKAIADSNANLHERKNQLTNLEKSQKSQYDAQQKNITLEEKIADLYAKHEGSVRKAASSEQVLTKAIEAQAGATKAQYDFMSKRVESWANVMKAQYESAAKIAEAESKAIEESMKSLGDSTKNVTDLMNKGWDDYVKAVQNPLSQGSAKIQAVFEQQMQMQRELIAAQTNLAREQAETMRFKREMQASKTPVVQRVQVEGVNEAFEYFVKMIVDQITIKALSEGGTLCC
jgi:TP901 family phage tail tape measure protein